MSRRRTKRRPRRNRHGLAWRIAAVGSRVLIGCWKMSRAAHGRRKTRLAEEEIRQARQGLSPKTVPRQTKKFVECISGNGYPLVDGPAVNDAISALVNLGYRRTLAAATIAAVVHSAGDGADTATLIRQGLRELAK